MKRVIGVAVLVLLIVGSNSACSEEKAKEFSYKSGHGIRHIDDTSFLFYEIYSSGHHTGSIYRVEDPQNLEMAKSGMYRMANFEGLNSHAKVETLRMINESNPIQIENLTNDQEKLKKLINKMGE